VIKITDFIPIHASFDMRYGSCAFSNGMI